MLLGFPESSQRGQFKPKLSILDQILPKSFWTAPREDTLSQNCPFWTRSCPGASGQLPERTLSAKIIHFGPNPVQELPDSFQREHFKPKLSILDQILLRSFRRDWLVVFVVRGGPHPPPSRSPSTRQMQQRSQQEQFSQSPARSGSPKRLAKHFLPKMCPKLAAPHA